MAFDKKSLEGPRIDRRTTLKLLGAAGFTSSLAGCTGGEDPDDGPSGSSIEAGWNLDQVDNLDPHLVGLGKEMSIMHNIHAGLLRLDGEGAIVGELASDWTIQDDVTYEFELVEGATFHNGDPVDADAVKWSMERLMETPESPHIDKVEDVEEIEVIDDHNLVIRLEEPNAPFLAFMTTAPGRAGAVVNQSAIEEMGDDYTNMPVGAGPFEIADRTSGESLTLTAFDEYFETDDEGNQLPYLDEIVINLIPEPSTMWTALETDSIQFSEELPTEQANNAEQMPGVAVEGTDTAYRAISFLANDPAEVPEWAIEAGNPDSEDEVYDGWEGEDIPTEDPRVRRAIAMAIDREELVETALRDWGIPAHSIWQPATEWLYEEEPENGQYHDPERARELLDEAGYTGEPRISGEMLGRPEDERTLTVLEQQLEEIGVEITPDIRQPSGFWDSIYNFEHLFAITDAVTNIDPWMAWYRQLGTPDGTGTSGHWQKGLWSNEEFDELIRESLVTPEQDEREEIVREAEQIFFEEAPYAMLYFPVDPVGYNENLEGVQLPTGLANFHFAQFDA